MRKCKKMNWPKVSSFFLLVLFLSLPQYQCGGRIRTFPSQGEVGGTWNLVLIKDGTTVRSPQLSVTQKERYGDFSGTTSDGATLTGVFDVNTVTITLNNADGSVTTLNTGEFSNDGRTISGTYSSTGSDGSGTWTATRPYTPPSLAVTPKSASLSCSIGQSQIFAVTGGGGVANYSVTATQNGTIVTISTTTLTTSGQFTVTANSACTQANGTVVNLTVSDTVTSIPVTVTISNP